MMVSKNGVTFGRLLSGAFSKLRKSPPSRAPPAPAGGLQQPRVTLGAPGAGAPLARGAFDFIWCSKRSPGLRAHSCGRQLTRGTLILARQLARRAPPVSRGGASGVGRGLSRGAGPAESGRRTVAWGEDCRVGRDGARSGHTEPFVYPSNLQLPRAQLWPRVS